MTLFLLLFLLSSFTWILAYAVSAWPSVATPFLWLVGSSIEPSTVSSTVLIIAFALQLLLLVILFFIREGRAKLQKKLRDIATKNIVLSERSKTIAQQMEKQDRDLKLTQSDAQELAIFRERCLNLQQLLEESKSTNALLQQENIRMKKDLDQFRSGKPQGFYATLQSWMQNIFP